MPNEAGSGGDFPKPGIDARVAAVETRLGRLETAVDEVRADLKAIRTELAALRVDVAEIKGRLANIPTTFQLVFMPAAFIVASFVGATGLSLAVLRLASPH